MNAHDRQELERVLRQTLQAMKERIPDWYGRALAAFADVSQNEHLSELEALAYQEDLRETLEEVPAVPGVH